MLMFLAATYAAIIKSWAEFWNEYTPEDYEREMQLWHRLH
jgi:hypothetical protein